MSRKKTNKFRTDIRTISYMHPSKNFSIEQGCPEHSELEIIHRSDLLRDSEWLNYTHLFPRRCRRRFSDFGRNSSSLVKFWLVIPELSVKTGAHCQDNQSLTDALEPHLREMNIALSSMDVFIDDNTVNSVHTLVGSDLTEGCKVKLKERDPAGNFSSFKGSRKSEKRNSTSGDQMDKLNESLSVYSSGTLPELPPDIRTLLSEVRDSDLELESCWTHIVRDNANLQNCIIKQQAAVWELLQTEVSFIKHLRSIFTVYVAVFCEIQKSFLPEISLYNVFSNLDELCGANGRFWLNHLSKPLKLSRKNNEPLNPSLLKDGFINIHNILKPYTRFCQEVANCRVYIQKQEKGNPYFAAYLQWAGEINSSSTRLNLSDLLALPFQRLTKYRLILDNVRKYSLDPSQIKDLDEMIIAVQEFVRDVNDDVMRSDRRRQLDELDSKIESYEVVEVTEELTKFMGIEKFSNFKLNSPMMIVHDEKYVREKLYSSPLKMKDSGQGKSIDVQCFLFTDLFLITKASGKKNQEKLKIIKPPIRLDRLVIKKISESSIILIVLNEFQVLSNYYLITVDNKKSAEAWHTQITEAKKAYKKLCHQDSTHSDVSTASNSSYPGLVYTGSSPNLSSATLNRLSCSEYNSPTNGPHVCSEPPRILDKRQRAMTLTSCSSLRHESRQYNYASLKLASHRQSNVLSGSFENLYHSSPQSRSPSREDSCDSTSKEKQSFQYGSHSLLNSNFDIETSRDKSTYRHTMSDLVSRRKIAAAPIDKKKTRHSYTSFHDFNNKVASKSLESHVSQRKPTPPPIISISSVTDDDSMSSVEYIDFNDDGMPENEFNKAVDAQPMEVIQKTELSNVTECICEENQSQISDLSLESYDASPVIGRHLNRQRRCRTEPVVIESSLAEYSNKEETPNNSISTSYSSSLVKRYSYPAGGLPSADQISDERFPDRRQNSSSGVSSLSSLQINSESSSSNTINSASTDSIKTIKQNPDDKSPGVGQELNHSNSPTSENQTLSISSLKNHAMKTNQSSEHNPEIPASQLFLPLHNRIPDLNERRHKFQVDRKHPRAPFFPFSNKDSFTLSSPNEESSQFLSHSPSLIRRMSKSLSDIHSQSSETKTVNELDLIISDRGETSAASSRQLSDASQDTNNSELMLCTSLSDVSSVTMV